MATNCWVNVLNCVYRIMTEGPKLDIRSEHIGSNWPTETLRSLPSRGVIFFYLLSALPLPCWYLSVRFYLYDKVMFGGSINLFEEIKWMEDNIGWKSQYEWKRVDWLKSELAECLSGSVKSSRIIRSRLRRPTTRISSSDAHMFV